jgi:chromosome segregation ATPase
LLHGRNGERHLAAPTVPTPCCRIALAMEDRSTSTIEIADEDAAGIACSVDGLVAHRRRLQDIEADLTAKIELVLGELADNEQRAEACGAALAQHANELAARSAAVDDATAGSETQRRELQRKADELDARAAKLESQSAALESHSAKLAAQEAQLNRRQAELESTAAELHKRIAAADVSERSRTTELERLAAERAHFDAARRQLDAERDHLAEERAKTKAQRKTLAQQFKSQRAEQLAELGIQRAELGRTSEQLTARAAELSRQATELARQTTELGASGADLAAREQSIADLKRELAERATRLEQLQAQVRDLQNRVASTSANDENASRMLDQLRAEHASAMEAKVAELAAVSAKLADKVAAFDARSSEIAAQAKLLGEKTATLQAREKELIGQASQLERAENDVRRLTKEVDERGRRLADCANRIADREAKLAERDAQVAERDARLATLESSLAERAAQIEQLVNDNARLQRDAAQPATIASNDPALIAEVEELRQRHAESVSVAAALQGQANELQRKLAEAQQHADPSGDAEAMEDMQRRFEMAMQDLREQKTRNADLEEKLSQARRSSPGASSAAPSAFDWEAQKRRMMEAEFDEQDEAARAERLTIEDTIRITDDALAHKDEEIAELKQLLHNQSSNIGAVAVGAAAIAQMLDQDELVNQERERLKSAQDEWREKLRFAEVELSMERAKLARERMLLDEKIQQLQREQAIGDAAAGDEKDANGKNKRRWLSRLGIRDTDNGR